MGAASSQTKAQRENRFSLKHTFLGPPSLPYHSLELTLIWKALCQLAAYWTLVLALPSVDIDSGYYTVKFDSLLLKEAVVEGDSVIPPLRSEEAAESDEDSVDDSGYAKGVSKTT